MNAPLSPSEPVSPAPAAAMPQVGEGAPLLVSGMVWREYKVVAPIEGCPGHFQGVVLASMERVILVECPVTPRTQWRRQACEKLQALDWDQLLRSTGIHEQSGRRVEVFPVADGPTLRDWVNRHPHSEPLLINLVRQLAEHLHRLHAEGVVHLNLRADTVYVRQVAGELQVGLGGMPMAEMIDRPDPVAIGLGPLYAPPEAAGGEVPGGPGLKALDWWSLGRLVQECLLGCPVYAQILSCDAVHLTPEQAARALALLREPEGAEFRAGAIEVMAGELTPMMRSLLRGLLTSLPEGRWQAHEVLHCLDGETMRDLYDRPRGEQLFHWRDRWLSLPMAAELFQEEEHWPEGAKVLFASADDPAGLPCYLARTPSARPLGELLAELRHMEELPVWAGLHAEVRQTAIATLMWLAFVRTDGGDAAPKVRGYRVDEEGMRQLLADEVPADAATLLQAMTEPAYLHRMAVLGSVAGAQVLERLGRIGSEAIRQAVQHGWADASDLGLQAQLYTLALSGDPELTARVQQLKSKYAANRDAAITAMMDLPRPEGWMQALLAFFGSYAQDYGFITHEEANQQHYRQLRHEAEQTLAALFWHRLRRVLLASPALLAPLPLYAACWSLPVLLAAALGDWVTVGWLAGGAVGVRLIGWYFLNAELRRQVPAAAGWRMTDGLGRCVRETRTGAEAGPQLLRKFQDLTAEASGLALAARPVAWPRPRPFWPLWSASFSALALVLGISFWQFWPVVSAAHWTPDPDRPARLAAASAAAARKKAVETAKPAEIASDVPLYEEVDNGFGKERRGPLRAWDLPPPTVAPPVLVQRTEELKPEQAAYALVFGNLLLNPYPRKALNFILAVRVPLEHGFGLVLLDSKERRLADPHLFVLGEALKPRSWYQMGTVKLVYLGDPPGMPPENSLAQLGGLCGHGG